jgi:LPS-assembly lipoprotein
MWWSNHFTTMARFTRLGIALAIAGLVAGCFEPLYGERSFAGTGSSIREKLSGVDVLPIDMPNGRSEARLGIEVRNALLFDTTGGGAQSAPTHKLKIRLVALRQSVIVDIYTTRPDVENYGIDAYYTLTDIATGKIVVNGQTFARVSFDIPGQQQRFAQARGLRDAESRAAKVIADQIRSRLASFFVAGT